MLDIKDIEKIKHNIDKIDLFSLKELLKEEEDEEAELINSGNEFNDKD